MIITNIKRKGKSETYYVYVDDEYYALIEAEFIYKNHLKIGTQIEEQKLKQIKTESDKLLCSGVALNYISKSLKSEFQLKNYLKLKKFDMDAINETVQKLKGYGYLNDEYYATSLAKEMSKSKGKRFIKNSLMQKGVQACKIEGVLQEIDNEDETCFNVAQKWLRGKVQPLDLNGKQKLYRFLMARGFSHETVKSALYKLNEEINDDRYWCFRSFKNEKSIKS